METNKQTKIIAEPGKQELFIFREFDAPRNLAYKAFSDPELLLKFYAPTGIKMEFLSKEFKQGSAYRYRHIDSEGNVLCVFKGVIHEMTAPERIILTLEFEEDEAGSAVMEIMEFEAVAENRTRLTIQDVCRSVEDRDAMVNGGMEGGVVSIFNNLDELLAKGF